MARVGDLGQIKSKHKAIIALLPYSLWRERDGDRRMMDALLGVVRVPNVGEFMAEPIATLLREAGPDFPNRVMTLMSPHADWLYLGRNANTVTRWAEAALAVSYSEEVGQSVIDALLQIARNKSLQPYIPVDIWAWLKKRPSLPPICEGRWVGTMAYVVCWVRELGDVEILESYFLLVWSEWNTIYPWGFTEMCTAIREDLCGIGMGSHREVLIKRLDHVLGQLDSGLEHLRQQSPLLHENHIPRARKEYGDLREVLLEVNKEASEILTRMSFGSTNSFGLLTHPQNPTRRSFVHFLSHAYSCPSTTPDPRTQLRTPNFIRTLVALGYPGPSSPIDLILSKRQLSGRVCRTCRRFCLCTILCITTYRFTPLFLNLLVLSSHPSPGSSWFSLNDSRSSILPLACGVPPASVAKFGGFDPPWYPNCVVESLPMLYTVCPAFSLTLGVAKASRTTTGGGNDRMTWTYTRCLAVSVHVSQIL